MLAQSEPSSRRAIVRSSSVLLIRAFHSFVDSQKYSRHAPTFISAPTFADDASQLGRVGSLLPTPSIQNISFGIDDGDDATRHRAIFRCARAATFTYNSQPSAAPLGRRRIAMQSALVVVAGDAATALKAKRRLSYGERARCRQQSVTVAQGASQNT